MQLSTLKQCCTISLPLLLLLCSVFIHATEPEVIDEDKLSFEPGVTPKEKLNLAEAKAPR